MADDIAIRVKNIDKTFKLPHEKQSSLKGLLISKVKKRRTFEKHKVLENISFEIKKGEFFGIVGRNGSGKSTMLKLLAGIYSPDSGTIELKGKLTPFIELGVGFNPELTGRENVYLNGALLGFSRKEMDNMYEEIVDFAELENFMDQKLKNYSSGMQVRLAFSIAIRAKSDILLIDEVLAVGDAAFQTKCFDYFSTLKKTDATVIFVSHDKTSLERFCNRGILINDGKLIESGPIQKIMKSYSKIVMRELEHTEAKSRKPNDNNLTIAAEFAEINDVVTITSGKEQKRFVYGEPISVQYKVSVKRELKNPIFGVTIWQKNVDKPVYASNTLIEGNKETGAFEAGETVTFNLELPPSLNDGEYYVEPAIANESAAVFYDQQSKAATFFISGGNNPYSILASKKHISLNVGK